MTAPSKRRDTNIHYILDTRPNVRSGESIVASSKSLQPTTTVCVRNRTIQQRANVAATEAAELPPFRHTTCLSSGARYVFGLAAGRQTSTSRPHGPLASSC